MDERQQLPSASGWRRNQLCYGSFQLQLEAERLGQAAYQSSADAESGTRGHAWLDGKEVQLSDTERTTAETLKARSSEQIERIFQPNEPTITRERRLWLTLAGKPAMSGRFDLVAHYPKHNPKLALVQDFKFGFSEPDAAEDNAQLQILALLVALHLPSVEEVVVQLVSGPYGVTEARYTMAQLSQVYTDTVGILRAINAPDPPLSPSPEACKYCAAILICPAVREQQKSMMWARTVELPSAPEQASELLNQVEILAGFLKEVKAYYAKLLTDDPTYVIPGWDMVPGNILREVTDWDAARSRLGEYLEIKDLNSAADYRLGELEKALGKVLKLKGKPLRERMNEILKGLYVEKQNASSLKRIKGEGVRLLN